MKLVINKCFGGFGLSAAAVAEMAKRKGRKCYFFKQDIGHGLDSPFTPVAEKDADGAFLFYAFDIPNPNEVLRRDKTWYEMTTEERQASNARYEQHSLTTRDLERDDPDLVATIKKLGKKANGRCADLRIVEIPDGVEWEIDEYDGLETVDEKHRSWG